HTRSKRDWSSDVCSSDLPQLGRPGRRVRGDDEQWRGEIDRGGMLGDLGSYELGPPSEHLADVERGRPAAIGDERTEHSRHRFRIPAVTTRSRVDDLAAQA